jgi:hypothetical protein
MRWVLACCLTAVLGCDDPPAPAPSPPAAPAPVSSPRAAHTARASATVSAPPPAPLSSAERKTQHERLEALLPKSMPPGCKLKPVGKDAPKWLEKNPQVSSERAFLDGFAPAALPGAEAIQIQSALYLVYEEKGGQSGLFGFVFASGEMASFARAAFDRSRPRDAERFVLEQRADMLLVQWTDGDKGACWDAIAKHRAATAAAR